MSAFLLINKQTNKQTNADENIISLAEVIIIIHVLTFLGKI